MSGAGAGTDVPAVREVGDLGGRGYTFEEIEVGMRAVSQSRVTDEHIRAFAEVSGDRNPVHLDEDFARQTPFRARISQGMLTASYISAVFGTHLPGPGAIYIAQSLRFKRPVWVDDAIRTIVTVTDTVPAKRRVRFHCECRNASDQIVLEGDAELMVPVREPIQ